MRVVECNYENCSDDKHHPYCKEARWRPYALPIKESTAINILIGLFALLIIVIIVGIYLFVRMT